MFTTILRFVLIVFISFLPKISAEPHHDDGNILFESSVRSGEIHRRQVRSINDESSNAIDAEDSHRDKSSFNFTYRNADEWSQIYPECSGTRQSPIDINPYSMTPLVVSSALEMKGYQTTARNMTLINGGHNVQLTGAWDNDDDLPYISGGTLDGHYVFHQIHFHWGSSDDTGSEHTINNGSFPLEMHILHYKKDYGSVTRAMKHEDGLVVIAILFGIDKSPNNGIFILQKYADAIKVPKSRIEISPFPLSELHINFPNQYVTYMGSVTRPPCREIVRWILPATLQFLTETQLKFFRSIELVNGDDYNYRPTMPLNGRQINYVTFKGK